MSNAMILAGEPISNDIDFRREPQQSIDDNHVGCRLVIS